MKRTCLHLFATCLGLMALCQCQSPTTNERLFADLPSYPVIERKTVKVGDKTFLQRRTLVNENPRETIRESFQVN